MTTTNNKPGRIVIDNGISRAHDGGDHRSFMAGHLLQSGRLDLAMVQQGELHSVVITFQEDVVRT